MKKIKYLLILSAMWLLFQSCRKSPSSPSLTLSEKLILGNWIMDSSIITTTNSVSIPPTGSNINFATSGQYVSNTGGSSVTAKYFLPNDTTLTFINTQGDTAFSYNLQTLTSVKMVWHNINPVVPFKYFYFHK